MISDISPVATHVRYSISLTRPAQGVSQPPFSRYVAMRTSIEASDAVDEGLVRSAIQSAIKREMPHDPDQERLAKDGGELVWQWLEKLRRGENGGFWRGALMLIEEKLYYSFSKQPDCIEVSIFTKEDEEKPKKLFGEV